MFVIFAWTLWFLTSYPQTDHQTCHGSLLTLKDFVDERNNPMFNIAKHFLPPHYDTIKLLKTLLKENVVKPITTTFRSSLIPVPQAIQKQLWSYIKQQKLDHAGVPLLSHNVHTITDSTHKANILNDYFSSVFTIDSTQPSPSTALSLLPCMMKVIFLTSSLFLLLCRCLLALSNLGSS